MKQKREQIIGRDEHHDVRPAHREPGGVQFHGKSEKSHPQRAKRAGRNLDTLESVLADMMVRDDGR